MYKKEFGNAQGELVTINQMAEISNLGISTIRKVAEEAVTALINDFFLTTSNRFTVKYISTKENQAQIAR